MFKVFFIKIISFECSKKFGSVTESIVMGGLAKAKKFAIFKLWLD